MVVCDWGAIRALPRSFKPSTDVGWVVCDYTFLEAVHNRQNPDGTMSKLRQILEQPEVSRRLLIPHSWQDIVLSERVPTESVRKAAIIDWDTTLRLREDIGIPSFWDRSISYLRSTPGSRDYEQWKAEFVQRGNAFARDGANRASNVAREMRTDRSALLNYVKRPKLIWEFLTSSWQQGQFMPRAWRRELTRFPDKKAIGRWVRLTAYYALERLVKPDQADERFSNNFEDATYAFLASFAGSLATNDAGLRDCVRTLFPWVTIVDLAAT